MYIRFAGIAIVGALVLTACSSSRQLTGVGMLPQRVRVDAQESNYAVQGATARELAESMRESSPERGWFWFNWSMRWGYDQNAQRQASLSRGSVSQNRCGIEAIRITLTYRSVVPEWEVAANADPVLVEQWNAYTDAIRLHGEGHRDIALDAVREIHSRLERLETEDTNNCTLLQREARSLVDDIWAEHNELGRAYHQNTEAGRTQGVVWPPRTAPLVTRIPES
jgi:predicted secreted Zn-dependent protease